MESAELPRPLAGITVVDLTIALAGPYATQLLGGLGATVIKVENPVGGDPARNNAPYVGESGLHLAREAPSDISVSMLERGRNKLGLTLDLKHPDAPAVFADLVANADVVVENFSAGTADRLGVGYGVTSELNPRIVHVSISGFGTGDPGKGMDMSFQALSGLMSTPGAEGDGPVRNALPFGDLVGPIFAVVGTLAALLHREHTGRGQQVDVSLLGALTSLVATEPWEAMDTAGIARRTGNVVPRLAPFGIFATRDREHIALCAPTDEFARGVFETLGQPGLVDDPRFSSRDRRVANAAELHALVAAWAVGLTSDAAIAALEAHGVPTALVRGVASAVRDPRVTRRRETVLLSHPDLGPLEELYGSGFPVRFSELEAGYEKPPPHLGEHTAFILGGLLGYEPARIEALRNAGAI